MNTSELVRRDKFQFSMLLNDKRYRSYTFQFFALFILICAMAYLGKNLLENLAAAGLNISYSFLGEPAGYDINQRLIEYNSQSTHLRASIVGVLNTLLVAFLGCIAATFFGVTAGILRLSNNWIVAKLMMIYVEIFNLFPEITQTFYDSKIFLISPTTLWIVLNSIESLLKDQKINQNSNIIFQNLKELGKEIIRLEERIKRLDSHFTSAQNDLNEVLITTKKISNKKEKMLLNETKD